jgi:fatty-acyl-CoA synthase
LQSRTFDVEQLLDVIQDKKCQMVVIVGDVFAKPVVKALDANPGRWDLSSVSVIFSSGVMWSQETKEALLRHQPGMMLLDFFGSSEAIGVGQSLSTAGGSSGTAKFALGENARVITDDGNDVAPGSGEIGRVAVRGFTPIGYYKDPEKSAATFVRIDGQTYAIPGDYATVEADGSFTLLGRGSMCINTGGEKVFPEEVEEILKRHPSVHDSVVVGLPDESFGEAIVAVVEAYPDQNLDEDALITHVKGNLASFKAPKKIVPIATIARAPNGKVDYKRMRAYAADQLGIELAT